MRLEESADTSTKFSLSRFCSEAALARAWMVDHFSHTLPQLGLFPQITLYKASLTCLHFQEVIVTDNDTAKIETSARQFSVLAANRRAAECGTSEGEASRVSYGRLRNILQRSHLEELLGPYGTAFWGYGA